MIRPLPVVSLPAVRLTTAAISLAVLLAATLIALSGSTTLPAAGIALIGMAVVAAILLKWPGLGLVLLIPITFFVPFTIGTGSRSELNATIMWAGGLTLLWLAGLIADPNRRPVQLVRPQLALIGLSLVFVVALFVGQGHWLPLAGQAPLTAQIGGVAIVLLSVALFFVAAQQIPDERWLMALVGVFLCLGALFAIGILFEPLKPYLLRLYQSGSISSQFFSWLAVLAFGQAVFNRRLHAFGRISLGGLALVSVYSIYVSVPGWVSGWLPALAGMTAILLLRSRYALLLLVGGGLLLAPLALQTILADETFSYTTRVQAWQILTEIIKANPILGLGPANYYWYTPLFAISGYYGIQFNSHNQYVDLVAQAGILGLLAYLWFLVSMGWFAWKASRYAPEGFARGYVMGSLGGLATMIVAGALGDWVLPFVYNVGIVGLRSSYLGWLFLGGVVALVQFTDHRTTGNPG
jgi:O-antigen ligase